MSFSVDLFGDGSQSPARFAQIDNVNQVHIGSDVQQAIVDDAIEFQNSGIDFRWMCTLDEYFFTTNWKLIRNFWRNISKNRLTKKPVFRTQGCMWHTVVTFATNFEVDASESLFQPLLDFSLFQSLISPSPKTKDMKTDLNR